MSSLYQIYLDGLKRLRGIETPEDFSGMSSDLTPPETDASGVVKNPMLREREGGSPLTQPGGQMFPTSMVPQNILNQNNINRTPDQANMSSDSITAGDIRTQVAQKPGFAQNLANFIGIDYDKAVDTWKDKGGFEGLMANPAFTMGLAFMQAGAQGKSIGNAALDSVAKAAGISQQYKNIIESRKQAPIEATAADISETKELLSKIGISEGNWFENFGSKVKAIFGKGGSKTPGLDFDRAVEEISVQYQAEIAKKQAELKRAGKPTIIRKDDKLRILKKLIWWFAHL